MPVNIGEAIFTAGALKAKYIIHASTMVWILRPIIQDT